MTHDEIRALDASTWERADPVPTLKPAVSWDTEACPACGASWDAGPIPEDVREHFGGRARFTRLIGVVDLGRDCVVRWRCPDCGASWLR